MGVAGFFFQSQASQILLINLTFHTVKLTTYKVFDNSNILGSKKISVECSVYFSSCHWLEIGGGKECCNCFHFLTNDSLRNGRNTPHLKQFGYNI